MAKNATAVADAKKAENTMQTCKMPVGWSGGAIVVDAIADKGQDRKDAKGAIVEGREYVRIEFQVVNDEKFAGSKFSRFWSFYDSEKATAMDRFQWMLNDLENLGLPREIRENDASTLEDILGYFLEADVLYHCEVKNNDFSRDKKEVQVSQLQTVGDDDSILPPEDNTNVPSDLVGKDVIFMSKPWEVVKVDGNQLSIKSKTTGTIRTVKVSDVGMPE